MSLISNSTNTLGPRIYLTFLPGSTNTVDLIKYDPNATLPFSIISKSPQCYSVSSNISSSISTF